MLEERRSMTFGTEKTVINTIHIRAHGIAFNYYLLNRSVS